MGFRILVVIATLHTSLVGLAIAEEGHGHKHHASVFVGGTHTDHDDGFTVGLEYEYRMQPEFGIGVLGEYANLDHDVWIVGLPFVFHPYQGLRLLAMPGVELTSDHEEFLVRLGVGYDIPAGDWVITPGFNVDFVDHEENLIFGIAFGKSF